MLGFELFGWDKFVVLGWGCLVMVSWIVYELVGSCGWITNVCGILFWVVCPLAAELFIGHGVCQAHNMLAVMSQWLLNIGLDFEVVFFKP